MNGVPHADHDGHFWGVGRSDEPQARAGAVSVVSQGAAARQGRKSSAFRGPRSATTPGELPWPSRPRQFSGDGFDQGGLGRLCAVDPLPGRATSSHPADFEALHQRLQELEGSRSATRIYYLATAAQFYEETVERLGACGLADEKNGPRRIVIEKPFGTRRPDGPPAERRRAPRLSRTAGLSHRPLPGQGDGAEHPGAAVRQHDLRAGVEPQLRRPRADHRGRGGDGRPPRRFLRRDRRAARHVSEPPAATADDHGHGGAGALRGRSGARRKGEGACGRSRRWPPAAVASDTLRGQYRGYRDEPGVKPDSQTATFARRQAGGRQLALAGRAVLPAQRQGHVVPHDADRDSVSQPAAHGVRRRSRPTSATPIGW